MDIPDSAASRCHKQLRDSLWRHHTLRPSPTVAPPLPAHYHIADLNQNASEKNTKEATVGLVSKALDGITERKNTLRYLDTKNPAAVVPRLDESAWC